MLSTFNVNLMNDVTGDVFFLYKFDINVVESPKYEEIERVQEKEFVSGLKPRGFCLAEVQRARACLVMKRPQGLSHNGLPTIRLLN